MGKILVRCRYIWQCRYMRAGAGGGASGTGSWFVPNRHFQRPRLTAPVSSLSTSFIALFVALHRISWIPHAEEETMDTSGKGCCPGLGFVVLHTPCTPRTPPRESWSVFGSCGLRRVAVTAVRACCSQLLDRRTLLWQIWRLCAAWFNIRFLITKPTAL